MMETSLAILRGTDFTFDVRCLDMRHTTRSAFKRIKVGQVAKS